MADLQSVGINVVVNGCQGCLAEHTRVGEESPLGSIFSFNSI